MSVPVIRALPRPVSGGRLAAEMPRAGGRALPKCILPAMLLLAAALGCYTEDEIGSPLAIELEGPASGQVGEQLAFRYDAVGRSLQGIVFTWGDGAVDSLSTAGAQSAAGTMFRTYEAAGDFLVGARVEDSVEGVARAELTIGIREG